MRVKLGASKHHVRNFLKTLASFLANQHTEKLTIPIFIIIIIYLPTYGLVKSNFANLLDKMLTYIEKKLGKTAHFVTMFL